MIRHQRGMIMAVWHLDFAEEEREDGTMVFRSYRAGAIDMHEYDKCNLRRGQEFKGVP